MSASSYVVNMVRAICAEIGWNPLIDYPLSQTRASKSILSLSTTSTVKPRNSGLLQQPNFFHYYGVFHYFDGTVSRKRSFWSSRYCPLSCRFPLLCSPLLRGFTVLKKIDLAGNSNPCIVLSQNSTIYIALPLFAIFARVSSNWFFWMFLQSLTLCVIWYRQDIIGEEK